SFEPRHARERQTLSKLIQTISMPLRQIVGRKRGRFFLLAPEEVFFFRAIDGIIRAYTASKDYWVSYQLNYLESALPEELFFRAHRSAIINLSKIKEMRPYSKSSFVLLMSDQAQTEIQVSERQATLLRRRFPGL
ncbi:MAG TPA: LytTR family DNA-binding domain-containing protein, partial [Blastocatellia bacterium]|nr:LytTR family DNA-binding domain-containing protein [Blastocatellia bacterium]